jgi:hypothetical protein
MQQIFQNFKQFLLLCLITLLLLTTNLLIFSDSAVAEGNTGSSNAQIALCTSIDKEASTQAAPSKNIFGTEDIEAIAAIASSAAGTLGLGSVTLWTATSTSSVLWGILATSTTTVVAAPVAGIVATGGLLGYGAYKVVQYLDSQNNGNVDCGKIVYLNATPLEPSNQ